MIKNEYETQRLILRASAPDLAEAVADYCLRNRDFLQDTEPMRPETYYTEEDQRTFLEESQRLWEAGQEARFWIFRKDMSDRVIGLVALNNIVLSGFCSCFLSYKLDQQELRKGYALEGVGEVVRIAFQEMNLHRIEANIMPRNTPSLGLVKRLGFREEGLSPQYLRINGVWEDHIHMVLLNREWKEI